MDLIEEYHKDDSYAIIAIGGIGADFFKARGMNVVFELRGLEDQPSFEQVGNIISKSVEMYKNELFDELYVCYNHHVNSLTSQVRVQQMLPIAELDADEAAEEGVTGFELEPNREMILEQLLPQYTESLIYGAIVDAKTAEHAAGMTAMQTATDNAKNVINDLTIQYNRARQAAITQEITEIAGGIKALIGNNAEITKVLPPYYDISERVELPEQLEVLEKTKDCVVEFVNTFPDGPDRKKVLSEVNGAFKHAKKYTAHVARESERLLSAFVNI